LFNSTYKLSDDGKTQNNVSTIADPKPVETHVGITLHKIERFGTTCYVHIIDPKKSKIFVTPRYNFGTVKRAIGKYGAQVGFNGGGWAQPSDGTISNEVWYSDGTAVNTRVKDFRGYLNVSKTGELSLHETGALDSSLWNCWGFDRILIVNGKFNTKISDTYTKDARTGTGITFDNKLIILSAEGNDYKLRGLTFPEMASVLIEFGAITGGNNDGGSSTQCINTGVSENSLFLGSDGVDANVINHILVFATPLGTEVAPPIEVLTPAVIKIKVINSDGSEYESIAITRSP
jgi:exopolysaccharide biosynthesis protein